jgi:hypothetical protein
MFHRLSGKNLPRSSLLKVHETLHALNLPNDTKVTVSPELARQVCEYTHSRGIVSGVTNRVTA